MHAVELVTDGGACMVRGSNFKSFCMVALLVAEATQAVTPDTASLASTRLFQSVGAVAERGESRVSHRLRVGCLSNHTEESPPPNGMVPFDDRSEDCAPDEVCPSCFRQAYQLPGSESGKPSKSKQIAFDPDMLLAQSGWLDSSRVSERVRCSSALIHTLCRMTCSLILLALTVALVNESRHDGEHSPLVPAAAA